MGHQLVAEKIEINPMGVAASLFATEEPTVKGPGGLDGVDGKGQMKRGKLVHEGESMTRRGLSSSGGANSSRRSGGRPAAVPQKPAFSRISTLAGNPDS